MAKPTSASVRKSDLVILGFDTEYVYRADKDPMRNEVLCYTFYVKTDSGISKGIVHTKGRETKYRLNLKDLIGDAIQQAIDENVVRKWPNELYAVAHFTRADIASFKDFPKIKTKFDSLRKSYTTITKPYDCVYWDRNKHRRDLKIHLRDSTHLAPQKLQSLKDLGDILDVKKMSLPEILDETDKTVPAIERMDLLRDQDPELFERYAIRDAEIAAEYLWKIVEFSADNGIGNTPPLTVGGMAVNYIFKLWDQNQIRKVAVLGTEEIKTKQFNLSANRFNSKSKFSLIKEIYEHEPLAVESYHGGRNEAFVFGFTDYGNWTDIDLSGAYTTAMAAIKIPDYKNIKVSLDIEDYRKETLGVARIKFKFPSDTKFPCLPVRTDYEDIDHGLIFPLEGETYVASPEIELALHLKAEIEILHGVIIPWLNKVRPFEEFSKSVRAKRDVEKEAGRGGGLFELLWKDMGNSVYGKSAQGMREKRVYDSRSDQSAVLPPSKITQPFLAAYTTSIVRAVLGELISTLPTDCTLVSVTTDGFLYNVPFRKTALINNNGVEGPRLFSELAADLDVTGPLSQFFLDLAERMKSDFLEIKHQYIPQILCFKTRGQASVGILAPTMKTLIAKAGVSPPESVFETAENSYVNGPDCLIPIELKDFVHNNFLLKLFLNRTADTKLETKEYISLSAMARGNYDLIKKRKVKKVNMEFDWKRELVEPEMVRVVESRVGNPAHITLSSRPWKNVEQFKLVRKLFDQWRHEKNAVLKTLADWKDWCDFKEYHVLRSEGHYTGRGAPVEQYKRWFLSAYMNGHFGPVRETYAELAEWLSCCGYPTSVQQIKDAKRAKGVSHESPPIDIAQVKALHELLLARYPTLPTA